MQFILFILLIHFLADFGLQTHEQATNKSTSLRFLMYHVGVYSIIWFLASYCIFGDWTKAFLFAIITFLAHFITDFITSKTSSSFFKKQDFHNGFVVVGFDQILHYIQLWYTFQILL